MSRALGLGLLVLGAVACGAPTPEPPPAAETVAETAGDEAPSDAYRIVLSRRVEPGARRREHTQHTRAQQTVVTVGMQVVESTSRIDSLELLAATRVREVSARGEPIVLEYEIEGLVLTTEEGAREVLPRGSVLEVRRVPRAEGDGVITLLGGTLSEEDLELLRRVVSTHYGSVNDDMIFGTDVPRRVGESWPLDTTLAAQDLNKIPTVEIRPEHVSGQTTLESVEEIEGLPCLQVRAQVRAEGFRMDGPGMTTEHAEVIAQMRGVLPVDPSLGSRAQESLMTMNARMRVPRPDGSEAIVTMRFEDRERSEYRY